MRREKGVGSALTEWSGGEKVRRGGEIGGLIRGFEDGQEVIVGRGVDKRLNVERGWMFVTGREVRRIVWKGGFDLGVPERAKAEDDQVGDVDPGGNSPLGELGGEEGDRRGGKLFKARGTGLTLLRGSCRRWGIGGRVLGWFGESKVMITDHGRGITLLAGKSSRIRH